MTEFPILSVTILLPLVGALLIAIIRGEDAIVARNARNVALWTSLITLLLSLLLWIGFDKTTAEFQFVHRFEWIPDFNIAYHVGIDGISLFFVLLSTFLTPLCILASWRAIEIAGPAGPHRRAMPSGLSVPVQQVVF